MRIKIALSRVLHIILLSAAFKAAMAYEVATINDGWKFRYESDSIATPVHLPHSWNNDAYHTRQYRRGKGEYVKSLYIPDCYKGKQVYLKLDGAASKSDVKIDGINVGNHIGAYSSHIMNITPYITPGQTHELIVSVDNSDADIPPYSADFTFMGGLYRDAWLICTNPIHFNLSTGPKTGIMVNTHISENGICKADITGSILNTTDRTGKLTVEASLFSPDGKCIASKAENAYIKSGMASLPFKISFDNLSNISLWSPESPSLYRVEISLKERKQVIDSSQESIGFRSFGFDEAGRFLLNGKPYKLRGICRHQDQKPMGIALSDEQHRRDIQMIKDMGANFLRISHYPQDDAVLEMCDRLGLIAWEEIPVIDYVPESYRFADNCEIMLREMIRCHYNHPSVAMWGYMNEILLRMPNDNQQETKRRTLELAKRLERVLAEEDSTRMSTMAFHGSDIYHEAGLAEITDVKGWNLYQGWYGGQITGFEDFLSRQHREHPGHRLIVSEYGAGSDMRLHSLSPEPFDFSMEYQQMYLEHYLPVIEDSAFVAGASHWNFIDFSSANRAESMPHINNKGLVTNARYKKDVYHYYQAAWHDVDSDTVAYIATRDWQERTGIMNENGTVTYPIKVYTNLEAVILKVNGQSIGKKNVRNCNAIFETDLRDGKNILELADADNPVKILDATVVTLYGMKRDGHAIDVGTGELAINVGSGCYFRSDDSGLTWLPDQEYTPAGLYGHIGGKRCVSQDEIALTADDPLLQRCQSGLEEYRVDVVPGRYEVELSFAELASPSAQSAYMLGHNAGADGNRWTSMDISINGKTVEKGFSPGSLSGAKTMVKRRYATSVAADGRLFIKFKPDSDGATTSLSAIKIRKL